MTKPSRRVRSAAEGGVGRACFSEKDGRHEEGAVSPTESEPETDVEGDAEGEGVEFWERMWRAGVCAGGLFWDLHEE